MPFPKQWAVSDYTKSLRVGCSSYHSASLINCGGRYNARGLSIIKHWSSHTHSYVQILSELTTGAVSKPPVKLNESNYYEPAQLDQSDIMGEGLTKHNSEKIHRIQNCVFFSLFAVGMAGVWGLDWTSTVKPRFSVCSARIRLLCFLTSTETKQISWGRWNDFGSASQQPLLISGL